MTENEKVKQMEQTIPADDHSIYSAFDDQSSTLPAVFGGLIGLQNKDVYAIIERTNLPNEEIRVVVDLMRLAEHGIGTPKSLDRPIPYIGPVVVTYMRAEGSVTSKLAHGTSRYEVIEAWTSCTKQLDTWLTTSRQQNHAAAG